MSYILLLLAFLVLILYIISLIKPNAILKNKNATRGKATLFFLLPAFVLFIAVGVISNMENDEQWNNPEAATKFSLMYKDLEKLPSNLVKFKNLEDLNLKENKLQELDKEIILAMPLLKKLNLSNNPIKKLPLWLTETAITELILDGTLIDSVPQEIADKISVISYKNTPLKKKEDEIAAKNNTPKGESFGQYAIRSLAGKKYGYKKNFLKGELYYNNSITSAQVDSLGALFIESGIFTNEKENSIQVSYNDDKKVNAYEIKLVTGLTNEATVPDELKILIQLYATSLSTLVFDGNPVHFHITDEKLTPVHTFRTNQSL